jgi:hypothetical protein
MVPIAVADRNLEIERKDQWVEAFIATTLDDLPGD